MSRFVAFVFEALWNLSPGLVIALVIVILIGAITYSPEENNHGN